ncbi:hypothetical protein [Aureivirga sp. CE67]|uniref:hypothetical protein n=1 Tax=Aureivirga sp. CE67 TaxID=1788983 RepID=UPI0018CB2181|nr:hypothetical protein [Aureivirga sp. CE67]
MNFKKNIQLVFLFLPFFLFAQTFEGDDVIILSDESNNQKSKSKKNRFLNDFWNKRKGIRFSGGKNDNLETEATFFITSYPYTEEGFGAMVTRYQNIGAGLEYLRVDGENVFGTKLSYENHFFLFSGQIGADFLFSDDSHQFRLMPKIGLSAFGTLTLYYGWNFDLIKHSKLQTQNHLISLQLNIM